jgi:hypothetical protein
VAVVVARPDADQHGARRDRVEERRHGVAAAVVGHLEDIGAQVGLGAEQIGLLGELRVAREQDRAGRGGGPEHHRAVVDLGAVVGVDERRRVRGPDHVEGQGGPAEPAAGRERDDRSARIGRLPRDLAQRPLRDADRADRDRAHRTAAQGAREPTDVVGVQMADHHQRDALHTEPAQAGVDRAVFGAGVDEHHPAGAAGGEHERVALPDVAGHGRPARGWPPRRHQPRGHEHQDEPQPDREQERAAAG